MERSITLGRYCDAPIKLHWTNFLILAILSYLSLDFGIIYFVSLVSVLLHEFGHVLIANRYGLKTKEILLTPFGGMALIQTKFNNFGQDFFIILAGPVANLIIGLFAGVIFLFTGFLMTVAIINLGLFAFNILPIFPLDGGLICRGFLAMLLKDNWLATVLVARFSQLICLLLTILAIYYGLYLASACFVFIIVLGSVELAKLHLDAR